MNLKPIGEIVRDARIAKGISQLELAKYAGICRYSVIELEHKGKTPNWYNMMKIQEKLGIKHAIEREFKRVS